MCQFITDVINWNVSQFIPRNLRRDNLETVTCWVFFPSLSLMDRRGDEAKKKVPEQRSTEY